MACRDVTIEGKTFKSKTWDAIHTLVDTDSEADTLYEQLLEDNFLSWFGDWTTPSTSKELGETTIDGEPLIEDGQYTNSKGDKRQVVMGTGAGRASEKTIGKIKEWLKRVGVEWKSVSSLTVNGVKYDGNGVADIFNKLIQIADGKEAVALPEEAMHFGVEIIEQTNPVLFGQMMNKISNYSIYNEVRKQYADQADYKSEDGSPNIHKLKKEAIAKLLAETYVSKEDNTSLHPELLQQGRTWLQKVIDWILTLVGKAGFNPFQQALSELENAPSIPLHNTDVFQQIAGDDKQTKLFKDIKENKGKEITKGISPTEKDENGKPKEVYFVGDHEVKNRVTDRAKRFYKKAFNDSDITKTDYSKAVDSLKAEYGTEGHKDFEHAHDVLIDKETGLRRTNPLDDSTYNPNTSDAIYKVIKQALQDRIALFPQGTRFLSEVKIYDPKNDEAGTIDLLAIEPDGKVNILDWKFSDFNVAKDTDVPWYKKKAWRIQIGTYKRILEDNYGVGVFGKHTEAVPIKANYKYRVGQDRKKYPVLDSITVGNANVKSETNDYLIPVGLETQTTGDKQLDVLIRKLNGLRETIESTPAKDLTGKFNKAEQLKAIEKAVRHLQMKQSVEPIIEQAEVYNKEIESVIDEFTTTLKGKDFNSIANKTLSDYGIRLNRAFDEIKIYTNLDNELASLFSGTLSAEQEATYKKIQDTVGKARRLASNLQAVLEGFAEGVATAKKIEGVLNPEVVVAMNKRWFNETSKLPLATLQTFYQYRREAQNKMDFQTLNENKELKDLKHTYDDLAKSKGLSGKSYFNLIKKQNANELIDEFNYEFYVDAKKALRAKSYEWIRQNINIPAYKIELEQELQRNIELIQNKPWTEERKNKEIERQKQQYDVSATDGAGWFGHYKTLRMFPKKDKWTSREWTELHKSENIAALNLYNWVRNINKKADDAGYLPNSKAERTFLPYVTKSLMEALLTGGKPEIIERIVRTLTVDEDTVGYGAIDKLTGQLIKRLPAYLTNETEKELSTDLFSNLALYNEFVNKYIQISEIEGIALALGRVEKNKGSIVTSFWGKPKFNKETSEFETIETNDKNADLYDRQIATLVYGQKYVESEQFDQLLGGVGKVFEKANKIVGKEIFPTNLENRQLSMNKSIDALNHYFQLKTLGLSPLASISNFLGGNFQSLINTGKWFDKIDFIKSESILPMLQVMGDEGKKIIAAMQYFQPFTEDLNHILRKQLSMNKLSDNSIQDTVMIFMRAGDKAVQAATFMAYLKNLVLIDGKVVNARDYIRSTPEFVTRYPSGRLREIEGTFESKVNELIEKSGLLNQSRVENDKLVIPGVDQNSEDIYRVRNVCKELGKKALGNMTPEEVRGVQQNVYLRSMMVFKNWIPSILDTRAGQLKYNSALEQYEWGRTRTVLRMLMTDGFKAIKEFWGAVKGTEGGIEALSRLYNYKKQKYEQETGKKFNMTPEEFYDMVRNNIRQQAKDVVFTITMLAMFYAAKAAAPDPSEDPEIKSRHAFVVRALDKFSDEVSFYYSPMSFQQIMGSVVFPSIGVFTDVFTVLNHASKELYGMTFDDDTLVEKNYVAKYVFRSFPITSQLSSFMPLYAPELAKDLGIKMSSQSRIAH